MQNLRWSRSKFINFVLALTVLLVAAILVREFEELLSSGKNTEVRSLVTSIALSILAYLIKASDSNRQAIQEVRREIQAIGESLEGLNKRDELQQQKLIELETQLAAQERYYWLKEKVDRLLETESKAP